LGCPRFRAAWPIHKATHPNAAELIMSMCQNAFSISSSVKGFQSQTNTVSGYSFLRRELAVKVPPMVEAYLLGLLLGLRHALEPDHLAAVSTLVAERRSKWTSLLGVLWGTGHTLSLLIVAGALVLLQKQMPPWLAAGFELGVALMLVILGARALRQAFREGKKGPPLMHAHQGQVHRHPGPPHHVHVQGRAVALRPLLVGLVHGLAGSGAMTALVVARMPSATGRLVYIVLFGIGSTFGMAALTGLVGSRLERWSLKPRVSGALLGAAGCLSLLLGCYWAVANLTLLG
jgi:hypothetical protein